VVLALDQGMKASVGHLGGQQLVGLVLEDCARQQDLQLHSLYHTAYKKVSLELPIPTSSVGSSSGRN